MSDELDAIRKRYESDVHWGVRGETNKRFVSDIGTLFARIAELETKLAAEKVQRETLATQYYASATGLQAQLAEAEERYQDLGRKSHEALTLVESQIAEANKVIDAILEVRQARNVSYQISILIENYQAEYRKKATS